MTKQTKSAILLHNGDFFDFKDPRNHDFDIKCIAHALSNLCRYTGHSKRFYSVAEHCVIVSRLVPEKFALEGLMHDASEAYCGDVASPLKQLLPNYKEIEDGVQEAIAAYFGLTYPFPKEIKEADVLAYVTERQSISNTGKDAIWFTDVTPRDFEIKGLSPTASERAFLERFKELTANGQGYEILRAKAAA
jgi:5'-deoxynucleotidase YfbR-like HD superfamily hydrolase